jgi:23S rRNA (cytosine1962-C5)-methyltransferase
MTSLPHLRLKAQHQRRVKRGHPWVYSNEIDVAATPLKGIVAGGLVCVVDADGVPIGCGHASPSALVAVRLLCRTATPPPELIRARLARALEWRERVFDAPFYRWVFGDGDGLPGLVIDRHGDACVLQTSSAGMERALDEIVAALDALVQPNSIVLKNDHAGRGAEGLPQYVKLLRGAAIATVVENGAEYRVNLAEGQKTGWFYDQRDNRARFSALYRDAAVLDLYSYVGAWGIHAARCGARRVVCVDSSQPAVTAVAANAGLNGVAERVVAVHADVDDYLRGGDERFEVVIVDPPALIRRRKDLRGGVALYRHLNRAALARLAPGGLLVSCSCSAPLDAEMLLGIVRAAARGARRELVLVGRGTLPADHPVHPLLPDSEYLKCLYLRAVD